MCLLCKKHPPTSVAHRAGQGCAAPREARQASEACAGLEAPEHDARVKEQRKGKVVNSTTFSRAQTLWSECRVQGQGHTGHGECVAGCAWCVGWGGSGFKRAKTSLTLRGPNGPSRQQIAVPWLRRQRSGAPSRVSRLSRVASSGASEAMRRAASRRRVVSRQGGRQRSDAPSRNPRAVTASAPECRPPPNPPPPHARPTPPHACHPTHCPCTLHSDHSRATAYNESPRVFPSAVTPGQRSSARRP